MVRRKRVQKLAPPWPVPLATLSPLLLIESHSAEHDIRGDAAASRHELESRSSMLLHFLQNYTLRLQPPGPDD